MMIAIANYKETFHPGNIKQSTTFSEMMRNVFNHVNHANNWMIARDKLKESFYSISAENRDELINCTGKEHFFESVLRVYTTESFNIYHAANESLRRQVTANYTPSGFDISLSPYILLLQAINLFWKKLTRTSVLTYRCVYLNDQEIEAYEPGTTLTWPAFTSSSFNKQVALGFPISKPIGEKQVMFEVDNTRDCIWQPRTVQKILHWEKEEEVMHPAGTMFKVISRT